MGNGSIIYTTGNTIFSDSLREGINWLYESLLENELKDYWDTLRDNELEVICGLRYELLYSLYSSDL